MAKKYIVRDAQVHTDEHPAYAEFMARYEHRTVNHSTEFSTDDGVSNNQAESYFSRMRRMVMSRCFHREARSI
ncbi:transposase [Variovorax sp. LjRoot84]|uniref:transposase n=1 Tax=Variovorax sp. LjRoot84 TaxID=3342340 RepID=UPI003F513F25